MDWITGEKFQDLASRIFTSSRIADDDYSKLTNTFNANALKELNFIYTHTMYIPELFFYLRKREDENNKVIVISHNSDNNLDGTYKIPKNVIKWFSTNIAYEDKRVESIPIGLENERWFQKINKKEKMLKKLQETKRYKNLVYVNFNYKTNPNKRNGLLTFLKDKPYATNKEGRNGLDFDNYLDGIYNHKFVVCPQGNGIDTHRTWETLYMGSIPIEKRNLNNKFYTDLPICFVDDWEELTEEFLNREFDRIQKGEWNMQKLTFEYWKNKILSL